MNHTNRLTWWAGFAVVLLGIGFIAMQREPADDMAAASSIWRLKPLERDIEEIRADTLRVLVLSDPLTWEERPKAVTGFEWELLERFARQERLVIQAIPMDHLDSMVLALQEGRGDVIAAQLTSRRDRRKYVAFTEPYRMVRPVIASLRPDPLFGDGIGPQVDTAEISSWSPFADPDHRIDLPGKRRIPVHVDPSITPEDLLMEVVIGRHGSTVITDARAAFEAGRFPVLQFSDPIGPAQPLCFAVRKNARGLQKSLDRWLTSQHEREARAQLEKAYSVTILREGPLRTRRPMTLVGDSISPFDEHFRTYGDAIPWDWELLAAMAYKESRFDSTVVSRMGAQGIMQIMPQTAARFGLSPDDEVAQHIRAAAEYLGRLDEMWRRAVPDKEQRLRFVLASYNAGPGHIVDAQRLAQKLGLDPNKWDRNVERAILLKAKPRYFMMPEMKNGYCIGSQVFHYVRDVLTIYRQLRSRPRTPKSELISSIPGNAEE